MGWKNVFQVEIDKFCTKVLEKNFPNVKRYGDIKEFDGTKYRGAVDILSGGFPCQPFSVAGKRKGKDDDRYLWPEYLRVIHEIKPSYVIGENVPGIIDMELDNIIADLESEGYQTEQFIIPACGVGARHRRARLWVVGISNGIRLEEQGIRSMDKESKQRCKNMADTCSMGREAGTTIRRKVSEEFRWPEPDFGSITLGENISYAKSSGLQKQGPEQQTDRTGQLHETLSDSNKPRSQGFRELRERPGEWTAWKGSTPLKGIWQFEPSVGRVANGIPRRVDRIKGLGNAIVPQVAYEIFKVIQEFDNEKSTTNRRVAGRK